MTIVERFLQRLLPHSLVSRSSLILVTPIIILQIASAFIFYDWHWDALSRRLAITLAGEIAAMSIVGTQGDFVLLQKLATMQDMKVAILPANQWSIIHKSNYIPYSADLPRELAMRLLTPFKIQEKRDGFTIYTLVSYQGRNIILAFSAPIKRLFSGTVWLYQFWQLGVSLLLLTIALLFMRGQIRPIKRLGIYAENIGKGQIGQPLKPQGATEVRQAIDAFNIMSARIQKTLHQRTVMLAAVSHDLRTPLTRLNLEIAMLPIPKHQQDAMQQDIGDMNQMIAGYLAFAEGDEAEKIQELDIILVLNDVVAGYVKGGGHITVESPPTLMIRGKYSALKRAFNNIVGNACRYAKTVTMTVQDIPQGIKITIDDNGQGIPMDKREDVFRPFTRLDNARRHDTGGVGLGLAIARDSIRSHGGDITLEDSPLGGLRVIVTLPV
jgi:two-component system, OmpR family, osmolarity sensor histidine kinase EnvZ